MAELTKLDLAWREGDDVLRLDLTEGHLRIGRRSRCEIWLGAPSVSKIHGFLLREGERVTIEDAQSQNGTFLNGERVLGTAEVRPGDAIDIGAYRLYLLFAGAPLPEDASKSPPKPPRIDPSAVALAAILTAALGLGAFGVGRALLPRHATGPAPRAGPAEAFGGRVTDPAVLSSREALQRGASAYLAGDLGEARRYMRLSDAASARPLLELIEVEIEALVTPDRPVSSDGRAALWRRVLRADPPAAVKARMQTYLERHERGDLRVGPR